MTALRLCWLMDRKSGRLRRSSRAIAVNREILIAIMFIFAIEVSVARNLIDTALENMHLS